MFGTRRRMWLGIGSTLVCLRALPSAAAPDPFQSWLAGFRREALDVGISTRTLDAALNGIGPIPAVLEADARQPEGQITFEVYRRRVVNDTRIGRGRELLVQHRDLLDRVQARYGVPPQVLVALW